MKQWGENWNIVALHFRQSDHGVWRTLPPKVREIVHKAVQKFKPSALWGHSAGAQLLSRLLALDHEWLAQNGVKEVYINNAGSFCIPNGPRPWPFGHTVSLTCVKSVRVFVRVGANDSDANMKWAQPDEVKRQGPNRYERALYFVKHAISAWNLQSVEIVPGVGHDFAAMMKGSLPFPHR